MSQAPVSATLGGQSLSPKRFSPKQLLGLAASIVAIATSVVSCQMKQAELQARQADLKLKEHELAALKQQQADEAESRSAMARKEYLGSLNGADRLSQARILRFIIAVETDERLQQWARLELSQLEKAVDKETVEMTKSVENLAEAATTERGEKAEEAQVALAVRSVDLARLKLAKSTIEVSTARRPDETVTPPKPERKATKAECFAHCAPDARECEAGCDGDRSCMKTRCFPQEAACRESCLQGPPPD